MKPAQTMGLGRIMRATKFSMQGLKAAWQHEAAFRQESILVLLLFPLLIWLQLPLLESLLLLLSLFLVLMAELVNSAIEAVVDRVSTEKHPLSGRAKDIGSAVVFLALIFAGICWSLLALPRAYTLLF